MGFFARKNEEFEYNVIIYDPNLRCRFKNSSLGNFLFSICFPPVTSTTSSSKKLLIHCELKAQKQYKVLENLLAYKYLHSLILYSIHSKVKLTF